MARIFITGSADGLGQLTAKALIAQGHKVVLHARNEKRSREALAGAPGSETAVTADLSSMEETIGLSEKVNALGGFDAIIHNAAVYNAPSKELFAVNTIAPYLLTCLLHKPGRLIYMSSGLHKGGRFRPDQFRPDTAKVTYSDTKLHVLMLSKSVARKWADVFANTVNPGWVPTRMGGSGAPDSFESGVQTQVWLAASDDARAKVSGRYFHHMREASYNHEADDVSLQERLLTLCREMTGVVFPIAE